MELEDLTLTQQDNALRLWVQAARGDGRYKTIGTVIYLGVASDLVQGHLQELAARWLWGTERDLIRAMGRMGKAARAYRRDEEPI